ncbi:MAG: CoA transferase [Actinobacteria bacterium]|nr:CoA transferase [Actinomycetota bacterium]
MEPFRDGLLAGVRVLDFSLWRPGPYATQLLAELGADVLKVEPPGGDPMRTYPALFASLSANKRSIALDLKDDADRARALELAADTDVVVEGYRPGVVDRLGVGYDDVRAVNPSVIYCSVSGLGQDGPLRLAPGHDLNYQAWAGALSPEGGEPVASKLPIADLAGGMAAAFAIVAAVVRRQRTGEGERVDVAMADVLATWTGAERPQAQGTDPDARGVPGYGTFVTADGRYLVLGVLTEQHFWAALCDVLKLERVRDVGFTERLARQRELQGAVADAIAARPRDELVREMQAADVPVAPVLDRDEMLALDHFRARGVSTADPWADPAVGYPVRLQHHPAGRATPPPALDEHRGASFRPRPEPPG